MVIRVGRRRFRCNALPIQRFSVPPCFRARPVVSPQYLIEIGLRNGLMRVHYLLNRLPDSGETHVFLEKSWRDNFIGRVQTSGKGTAGFPRAAGQAERGEIIVAGPRKLEFRQFSKIERW